MQLERFERLATKLSVYTQENKFGLNYLNESHKKSLESMNLTKETFNGLRFTSKLDLRFKDQVKKRRQSRK